jgi:hypothetical protein
LRRVLHAAAVPARVTLRPLNVDFKNRVVFKREMISGAYTMQLSLTNEESKLVQWSIRAGEPQAFQKDGIEERPVLDSEIGICVGANRTVTGPARPAASSSASASSSAQPLHNTWKIEPASGLIPPHGEVKAMVSFVPCDPYKFVLPLALCLDGKENTYLNFSAQGTGSFPMLHFDRPEVFMPTVPLNVKSTALFHIRNEGYTNLELKYKLPQDTARVPLAIRFPSTGLFDFARYSLNLTSIHLMSHYYFGFSGPTDWCWNRPVAS